MSETKDEIAKTEVETKVVSLENEIPTEEEISVDEKALKAKQDELESFKAALREKVYAVKIKDKKILMHLIKHIEENAPWESIEALGVTKISKELNDHTDKIKSGMVYLGGAEIQAINFFLSKHKGKGKEEAEHFLAFFRPVYRAVQSIQLDKEHFDAIKNQIQALEQGIEIPDLLDTKNIDPQTRMPEEEEEEG